MQTLISAKQARKLSEENSTKLYRAFGEKIKNDLKGI